MTTKKQIMAQVNELKAQYEKETDIRKKWGIIQAIFDILVAAGIVTAWIFKPSKEKMKEIAWNAIFEYDMGKTPEIREYLTLPQLDLFPEKKQAYDDAIAELATANTKLAAAKTDEEKAEAIKDKEAAKKKIQDAKRNPEYKEEKDDGKKGKGKGKGKGDK